jgi:uncharacterized protein YndB with AHSA1/START domain
MPIHFDHSIEVPHPPAQVFAILDDVTQTPKWLARCTGIELLTPGPLAVGSKLRYSYRDGRRSGVMDSEVAERIPDQRLSFRYEDKMMLVGVHFNLKPAGTRGTRLTHAIDLSPKTFFCKLLSPLIRKQLPKQTMAAMEAIRALLASSRPQQAATTA